MGKIYSYLLRDFFSTVIRYFLILFLLVSIMYFVRIANYTSVMTLSFVDIFQIYFYYVPQIVIYTFPLTFFIALTYSLHNFSKDGEMLVLFSLGKSPRKVLNLYLIVAFLTSIALIINSLILMPLSEQASKNFMKIKKMESKINVKGNEVGQSVSGWNIFTKKVSDNRYNDLVLFSKTKDKEQLILAKNAQFNSTNSKINLVLNAGNHYLINHKETIQTGYQKLTLTNNLHKDELSHKSIFEYWSDAKTNSYRSRWLSIYILLSMFPLLSVFNAFSIGVINSRVQKRVISLWVGISVLVYYGTAFKIAAKSPLLGSIGFITIFTLISFLIFNKIIIKRY